MSRHLVALFVAVQSLDLLTYLQAPHLEANPAMAALPPVVVAIAKLGGVCLALVVVSRIRTPSLQSLALAIGIAIGAFGLGANVATLSIVAAAEAPRPAAGTPAPSVGMREGRPDQQRTGASRIAAPSPSIGTRPASREAVPDRKPSGTTTATDALRGVASWFRAPSGTAAAGPALRRALGSDWRGSRVSVCGPEGCATVRLTDWMRRDRMVDLNAGSFRAVCGPLSVGVCRVTVDVVDVKPPETDTEG